MRTNLKNYFYELTSWCVLPFVFILIYLVVLPASFSVVLEHFYIVLLLIFSLQLIHFLIKKIIKNNQASQLLVAFLYSSVLFFLSVYYAITLFGLKTWKHVITKELISTYLSQLKHLLDAVQISFPFVIFLLVTFFVLIFIGTNSFTKKHAWVPTSIPINTAVFYGLLISLLIFTTYWSYDYVTYSKGSTKEPIKLTMLAGKIASTNDANQGLPLNQTLVEAEKAEFKNYKPNPDADKHNLVIIVVDALRPDHTNIYGYHRKTTPYLNQLASQGLLKIWQNVKSTCSETTCAHAGLLAARNVQQITPNMLSLQNVLGRHGYQTKFIISGDHVRFYNIRDIYGQVSEYFDGGMQKEYYINDDRLVIDKTSRLEAWNGQPTMLHYHLLSAHNLGKRLPQFSTYTPAKNYSGMLKSRPQAKYTNYYDNGVLQTDWVIQQLLNILKEKGYLKNTLVLITADHGESLGEHGVFIHSNSVYETPLHVPVIFAEYGYKSTIPNHFSQMASLIDIAPSILNDFKMPIPNTWQGIAAQNYAPRDYTYFMMRPLIGFYDQSDKKTLWKYWFNEETGEEFAYNLTSDPEEDLNILNKAPAQLSDKWKIYKLHHLNNLMRNQQEY